MVRPLPENPRQILLIKAHSAGIGDILRSSAAWAVLKQHWPEAELHLLFLNRWPGYPSEQLIADHHLLSSAHFLPLREGRWGPLRGVGPRAWREIFQQLRALSARIRPDLIIDHEPHGMETGIVARWWRRQSLAPTVGVAQVPGRGWLYDYAGPSLRQYARSRALPQPMDYAERDFAALAALGLARHGQGIVLRETAAGRAWREDWERRHPQTGRVSALNIGCGTPGAALKRPSPAVLATALKELHQRLPHHLLLLGAADEAPINAEFVGLLKALVGNVEHIEDLAGKTSLSELTGVLQRADLVLSSDSGPYHMAVAMGRPTLAYFNFANPEHYHQDAHLKILVGPSASTLFTQLCQILEQNHRATKNLS
ncbi:glycosyltransferase family 9 protein [Acidithiobacillus sp.]|uniref:glycosyltransferase family 9 protein n=1 Tax=Acidithiobacillus sp. TaxID=1872118 RepID=UPI0025BA5434|nr:glycosyltransferase family 9 protein [Acidithiobacillus sp.]